MKKFTLFAFLVLFTSVFIPSCQKDGFLQEKPEITDQNASKFITFKDYDGVGDRGGDQSGEDPGDPVNPNPTECCYAQWHSTQEISETIHVQFVYKKPSGKSRYSVHVTHVETGQSFLVDQGPFAPTINNCEYASAWIWLSGIVHYYFPGVSGHFTLTYRVETNHDTGLGNLWYPCAIATSPQILVKPVE